VAYSIAYRARAREELDTFGKDHGETFCAEVNAWLLQLADQAERNDSRSSIDVTRILEELVVFPKKNGAEVKGVSGYASARIPLETNTPGRSAAGRGCKTLRCNQRCSP
jgi:hypothetical protein